MESGGEGSGIWKSIDSGDTWEKLEKGLPEIMGKIGIDVSRANPERIYANIEAEEGGLFRSDDDRRRHRRGRLGSCRAGRSGTIRPPVRGHRAGDVHFFQWRRILAKWPKRSNNR